MTHDRVEQLREDTAGGPSALAALLDGYAAGGGPLAGIGDRPAGIAFSGLGSSRYGALTAAAEARRLEIPAWPELASSAAPTPPAPGQVLVAISASGRTHETVEAARRYRAGGGRVIAVTNEPESPSATGADHVLPLLAGGRRRGDRHADVPCHPRGLRDAGPALGGPPTGRSSPCDRPSGGSRP